MGLISKCATLWAKIKHLPKRYTLSVSIFAAAILLYSVIFLIDKPVVFSYAGATCAKQLTLFPELHDISGKTDYKVQATQTLRVGNVTILSQELCFTPVNSPAAGVNKVSTAPFGSWLLRKTFAITAAAPPTAHAAVLSKPIPVSKPLTIPLSGTDKVFTYHMKANGARVVCDPKANATSCDVSKLKLSQGAPYELELTRQFGDDKAATLVSKEVTTLSATHLSAASVKPREVVYAKPKTFELEFDKKITKITPKLYRIDDGKQVPVAVTPTMNDKKVLLTVADDLARSKGYELLVEKLEADDGSGLEAPYKLPFTMSGGPKVTGVNVNKTGVPIGATVVVTFDQPLSEKQDISKIVTATGGAAIAGKKNNQLLITLASVPKCGDFSIKVTNDLQSNYDIGGNSAWDYAGRTVCHTVGTIGYSSKGRAISAYYFGNGPSTVLYTGAIHGNEISTKYLMEKWIDELEANARTIPAGKSVVVVPQVNPDGVGSGARVNARNVDLNRNFATSDWQKDITTVNNKPFPGGGGESAMSEPEAQALSSLAQRLRPSLVLSYHSIGGIVAANQAGSSNALAGIYSQLSGYRNTTGQTGETFEYSISGTADDWYAEKLGVPSILIELGSNTAHQFSRNQKAMWAMLNS
jgi:predicted deacylase